MILKIRSLSADLPLPEPVEKDGVSCLSLDPNDPGAAMIGELVRVPRKLVDRCERIAGAMSLTSFLPLGLDVKLDAPNENLNGLWVQRPVYEAVRKENGESSADDLAEAAYSSAFEELELSPAQQFTGDVPEATEEDLRVLADAIEEDAKGKAAS